MRHQNYLTNTKYNNQYYINTKTLGSFVLEGRLYFDVTMQLIMTSYHMIKIDTINIFSWNIYMYKYWYHIGNGHISNTSK